MPDLPTRIDGAVSSLQAVVDQLTALGGASIIPPTKNFYTTFATWGQELREAKQLIEVRTTAFQQFSYLYDTNNHCPLSADNVIWNKVSVPYWHARLMAFQSYMACTWAAYDTLAKISARLCLKEAQSKNLSLNFNYPNLICQVKEENKTKLDGMGFHFPSQLKESYGWSISFSYACRNWIMHEGHYQNAASLFDGSSRISRTHPITPAALDSLLKECDDDGVQPGYTTLSGFPDAAVDLLAYLVLCHQEIDECAGILLAWACSAAKLQAELLLTRYVAPAPVLTPVTPPAPAAATTPTHIPTTNSPASP